MKKLISISILLLIEGICYSAGKINPVTGRYDLVGDQVVSSSSTLPPGSTNYIQNTLTPTTTTQQFAVHTASITQFLYANSSATINGPLIQSGTGGTAGYVLTSNGPSSTPTWQAATGGGGGTSTLAVGTGTATNFTNNITSPTAAISFHGDYFRATTNGTTSFITLAPKFSQTYTPLQIVTSSGTLGISNSTTTRPMALYDASAHEWADWQSLQLKPYSGNSLSADIAFTMASATSGGVTWSVQIECITSYDSADYDTASFDTFNSTSGATVPATAGYLKVVTIPITNADSCASGDSFRPRLNRLPADSGDTASGDAEFRWMRIYE